MIIGIGSDLIDIRRIERSLERYGERFIVRLFTDVERARSERRRARAASYAKRFAAKEACAKALGTGMSRGVFWRDMGVVNLPGGKPTMHLTNGAAKRLCRNAASRAYIGDSPDHHRRFSTGAGIRGDRGATRRTTAIFLGLMRLPIALPRTAWSVNRWPT